MAHRVLRLSDDGTELAELPAQTSAGAADAGRLPALNAQGVLDPSLLGQLPQDAYYVHQQMTPSDTWVVVHNLGKYPAVTIVDSAGQRISTEVQYDSGSQLTITFYWAVSGTAYLS